MKAKIEGWVHFECDIPEFFKYEGSSSSVQYCRSVTKGGIIEIQQVDLDALSFRTYNVCVYADRLYNHDYTEISKEEYEEKIKILQSHMLC